MPEKAKEPMRRALRGIAGRASEAEVRRLRTAIRRAQPLHERIDALPRIVSALRCPAALFGRDGIVLTTNQALLRKVKRTEEEILAGKVNLLDRVPNENYAVFEAVEGVFFGRASAAGDLVRPLSLFVRGDGYLPRDPYTRAVFCPIIGEDGEIAAGMVALSRAGDLEADLEKG